MRQRRSQPGKGGDPVGRTTPRKASLLYQASVHLLRAMALATVIIGVLLASIFHFSREKSAQREIHGAVDYLSASATRMEDRWQRTALRYQSRIEFTHMLDDPATRWATLKAYLTTQRTDETFRGILVVDDRDRVLFSFGFDEAAIPSAFPASPAIGWHFDAGSETLRRYYVQDIRLGKDGTGHLVLFRPMDNALLDELAIFNTHLFLRWQGRVIASSLGERGRHVDLLPHAGRIEHDGLRMEQSSFNWEDQRQDSPEIVVHREVESLFDSWEIGLGTILGLAGLFAALWLSVGAWVYRTARRITLVDLASNQFLIDRQFSPEVRNLLEQAARRREDEISHVAESLASLTAAVAQRDAERDAHEAQLRESEARVREITEVLADGVYVLDSDGLVTFVNAEAERLLGWSAADLLGRKGHETFHYKRPDGSPIAAESCPVLQTIITGEIYRSRNDWLICKDGSILPVSIVSSPIRRDGKVVGSVAAFHDISPRLKAEQALRESEEKFRLISTSAMDAIVIVDGNEAVSYWNPAAEKMFGYRADEAIANNLHQLITPARFRDGAHRGFEGFLRTGTGPVIGKIVEQTAVRKDGSEFPVELSVSALYIQGRWHALGVVRDISERKQTERLLQENKARMRALLDASDESVLLLEPSGRILEINAFGARRFGFKPDEMIGRNFFDFMPPSLVESRRAAVAHAAISGVPLHMQDRRGGVCFDNSLYPVKDENGKVDSVAVYAKDVTEAVRNRQVEEIFHHLDTVLLKWQMNIESIAQIFCDDLLPVFDLAATWIGRVEKDGHLGIIASAGTAEGHPRGQMRQSGLRDLEGSISCLPTQTVVQKGIRQKFNLEDPACQSCRAACQTVGAKTVLLLPLTLKRKIWGILAVYGLTADHFDQGQLETRLATIAGRLGSSLEAAMQQEWLTLLDSALAGVDNAVLISAADGGILWANHAFVQLSGYTLEELLGQTPKLFKSGVQSDDFYKHFWETISAGIPWQGEIVNVRRNGSRYTANQTVTPLLNFNGQVTHYVSIIEDISERKAMEERILHMAQFDPLTDLPNRGLFFDRLCQTLELARREGHGCALLFLDLDRFKEVNDRLGHAAGDKLLVCIAQRLHQQVRASDTVARLAGDEFTVILPNLPDAAGAKLVAEKILAAVAQPVLIDDQDVTIGVSIGIAYFPEHGNNVEQLLNAADDAMYRAKQSGRNGYVVAVASAAAKDPSGEEAPVQ